MEKPKRFSFKSIIPKIVIAILCVLGIKDPLEIMILETFINGIKYSSMDEGRFDIKLYQNVPTQEKNNNCVASIYKSNGHTFASLEKKFFDNDLWLSSDGNMNVSSNPEKSLSSGTGNLTSIGIFMIISKSPSPVRINNIPLSSNENSLLILTKGEYYINNLKNVLGISLLLIVFTSITISGFFANRKIAKEDEKKEKTILIIP